MQEERITNFIAEILQNKGKKNKLNLGKLSKKEVEKIKEELGFDLENYCRVMDNSAINHTLNHHSNPKTEAQRGQIAVVPEDFVLIPKITSEFDKLEYADKNQHGRDLIKYIKEMTEKLVYVEEIRTGRKEVALQTLYKQKSRSE